MAPARIVYDDFERDSSITTKRRKLDVDVRGHEEERDGEVKEDIGEDASATVPPHPLDIKPSGNAYTATKNIKDHAGLFRRLPDELLMQLLEVLNAADLVRLGSTCKALYAFCRSDDLWKTLFIEYVPLGSPKNASNAENFMLGILLQLPLHGVVRGGLLSYHFHRIVKQRYRVQTCTVTRYIFPFIADMYRCRALLATSQPGMLSRASPT